MRPEKNISKYGRFWRFLSTFVATGAGTGYAPIAPGTVASSVAVLAYWLSPLKSPSLLLAICVLGLFVIGGLFTSVISKPSDKDPSRAVWDEYVGTWLACTMVPSSWEYLLAAFLLFRFFDVTKPFPGRRLEKLPGGWGIMADDLLAGFYAGVLVMIAAALIGYS